jgi:hypothetical protein
MAYDALPYDPADPPREPPPGAHPTLWRLAYLVHARHRRGADGSCAECKQHPWPCDAGQLATDQMRFACGVPPSTNADEPP